MLADVLVGAVSLDDAALVDLVERVGGIFGGWCGDVMENG